MADEMSMVGRFLPWIASFLFGGLSGAAGSKIVLSNYGKSIHDHETRMREMEDILHKLEAIETVGKTVADAHESRISRLEIDGDDVLTEKTHAAICSAQNAGLELRLQQLFTASIKDLENRIVQRFQREINGYHKE